MLTFSDAHDTDLAALQAMHAEAAAALTARFGEGRWSRDGFGKRIDAIPGRNRVRVGWLDGMIVSSLRLQTKKPWAIDTAYFSPARKPLYLTAMVVSVPHQERGIGRSALEDARTIALEWGADAIRLDAYDAPAGAGEFYNRCGFQPRGRVVYRGNPLTYHELLLG
jgi:GNAT superfamily N-acetyltransferase